MIIFKKFSEKVRITNEDWKRLRSRFNPHNAVLKASEYTIKKGCPFCPKYHRSYTDECKGCPLVVFSDSILLGCESFLIQLLSDIDFNSGDIAEVTWHKKDDLEARTQLYKLQNIMEKIEKLKENKK